MLHQVLQVEPAIGKLADVAEFVEEVGGVSFCVVIDGHVISKCTSRDRRVIVRAKCQLSLALCDDITIIGK